MKTISTLTEFDRVYVEHHVVLIDMFELFEMNLLNW